MSDSGVNTVLLTLGRLPVALELARGFARIGWRVIVAEPFGMHLLRSSNSVARCYRTHAPRDNRQAYLDDLRRIVAEQNVSLLVPVSEESMHVAALHGSFGDAVRLFCAPQPRMLALHDKLRFNEQARQYGLGVPDSCAGELDDHRRVADAGDFVLKPRYSCSGRGVRFFERRATGPFAPGTVVQQRLTGQSLSSFSVARNGQLLGTVVYRGLVMAGSVAVAFERVSDAPAVERWVRQFVKAAGHTGLIGFDFIVNDAGEAFAIECNPRANSGIHFMQAHSLATAIASSGSPAIELRGEHRMQEGYSCFTATLGSLARANERGKNLRYLREARDVSWSSDDPWPFLLMMINTYRIILLAIVKRSTFAEVAALDIEWRDA